MADVESPVQVGFAEFIARLMSEVFDSVITSQVDQEERYAQMLTSAAMGPEEYGSRYLDDEDVAAETASLFPPRPEDKDNPGSVYEGSPYRLDKKTGDESPNFAEVLGLRPGKEAVVKQGEGLVLSKAGVDWVLGEVRSMLSNRHLEIASQIIARGLPRVVVDSGRINGKLTFHLTETTESASTDELPVMASRVEAAGTVKERLAMSGIKSVFTLPKARILPNVSLMVKQADASSPQSSQVKADVYGEVEITFKTVT